MKIMFFMALIFALTACEFHKGVYEAIELVGEGAKCVENRNRTDDNCWLSCAKKSRDGTVIYDIYDFPCGRRRHRHRR